MKIQPTLKIVLTIIFVVLWSVSLYADAGDLDSDFDGDGKVITDLVGTDDDGRALAIQPDGKIIVAGSTQNASLDFALARYNPDGSLDSTFDLDGKVSTDFTGGTDEAVDVVVQPDGKIIVSGETDNSFFALVRYNSNGSLDSTFDSDGKVTTDFGPNVDRAFALAVLPDGKIVAFGETKVTVNPDSFDFAVARYLSNGSLDTSFSFDGKVTTDFGVVGDQGRGVAVQTDGKIIGVGKTGSTGTSINFALVRYKTDGTLDDSFGTGGKVETDFGGFDTGHDVVVQPDGRIIVAGALSDSDFAMARYNSDGSLDITFDSDGKVTTDFGAGLEQAFGVVLQTDGKIVTAGGRPFALARYNADGTLDSSFGSNGKVTTTFGIIDTGFDVALQQDDKIIVAGATINNTGGDFAIARYEGDPLPLSIFSDDYENGILATDWTYVKPNWSESGGNLIGTPTAKKAEVIASPAFDGCTNCTMQASMQTAGGEGNKLWFLTWFLDKKNNVEVLMKEENDKWILRQRVNGSVVAKTKGLATILPNTFYNVQVNFDGVNFTLIVDGVTLATLPAFASPNGTVGFRVKNTTGQFGFVTIN